MDRLFCPELTQCLDYCCLQRPAPLVSSRIGLAESSLQVFDGFAVAQTPQRHRRGRFLIYIALLEKLEKRRQELGAPDDTQMGQNIVDLGVGSLANNLQAGLF